MKLPCKKWSSKIYKQQLIMAQETVYQHGQSFWYFNFSTWFLILGTVESRFSDTLFSDTLFSDKSRFSNNFAEDHFLVHKNISFSDNLVFSATPI